jgi:hypothetical protein
MSSRNGLLKLQVSIAKQSQILLDLDIQASQPQVPVPVASPVLIAPTTSTGPVASPVLTAPISSTTPVASPVLTAPTSSTVPKQLSPDRPEVLMQAYLAEKITRIIDTNKSIIGLNRSL